MTRRSRKDGRICGCSHEEGRHELVDGRPAGRCLHGCGCEGFHSKRHGARATIIPPPATPSVAVALAAIEKARAALHEAETALRASPGILRDVSAPKPAPVRSKPAGGAKGERRVLIAVSQFSMGATREGLTVATGYKRSSRDTYLQRLRASGFISDTDRIRITPAGSAWLGTDYQPMPTGDALVAWWRNRLPAGELVILDALLRRWPETVSRETLSIATGYKRSSRDTYLQRLRARELVTWGPAGVLPSNELVAGMTRRHG